jgi:hypothetical protein
MNKFNPDTEDRNGIEYLLNTAFIKSVDARKKGDFEKERLYLELRDNLLVAFDTANTICSLTSSEKTAFKFSNLLTSKR